MSTTEGSGGSRKGLYRRLKTGLLVSGIAAGTVFVSEVAGCTDIAGKIVNGIYPLPVIPPEPKPTPVPDINRDPIQIVVAFDRTRSAIIKQLPGVRDQTATFFEQTNRLKENDVVKIYTFAEAAQGKSFKFKDKSDLLTAINNVKTEGPRAHMETWVHVSIEQIVEETRIDLNQKGKATEGAKSGIAIIWTDGIDDKKGPQTPLPSKHVPVKILVPEMADIAHANKVKTTLGSNGVEVILADGEEAFGQVLEGAVSELDKKAEAATNDLRNAAKEAAKAADTRAKTAWQGKVDKINKYKKKLNDELNAIKKGIQVVFGVVALLCAAGVVSILKIKSLPTLKGCLVYKVEGEQIPTVEYLPRVTKRIRLNRYIQGESAFIEPVKKGVKVGNRVLTDGEEVVPGSKCFWYLQEPTDDAIRDLFKN